MQAEQIFQLANAFAMAGWIILVLLPTWKFSERFVIGIIITVLAILYTWLIFTQFTPADIRSFGSLDGVMKLFQNPVLLLAGWVHYLAFDLLAGVFIRNNAAHYTISHWLVVPCLVLTFLFGPFGLLLYLSIRLFKTKTYFARNF